MEIKTIAFITRVHPKRPNMLKVCVDSIESQTSDDYLHILLRDDKTKNGYGLLLANRSFTKVPSFKARYVMTLDDDDMLIDSNFVEMFRGIVKKQKPEIVFFKGKIDNRGTYPKEQSWGERPRRRFIAGFCFAVKLSTWKKHVHKWGNKRCGDYFFISACYENTKKHLWVDRIISKTQKQAGRGLGEHEHE